MCIDGDLFFFSTWVTPDFKADGCEWIKRKGRESSIRETVIKLTLNGAHVITGRYAYSQTSPV